MHRILHYIVLANRLRTTPSVHEIVPQVPVNWSKTGSPHVLPADGKQDNSKLPRPPSALSPQR
jgi:hypothetical protein